MTADLSPFLPGMEALSPAPTAMETAARVMLAHLNEQGLLGPQHALQVQLVMDLARAIGISAQKGRAAGMALASRELREAFALLPQSTDDAFSAFMKDLKQEVEV